MSHSRKDISNSPTTSRTQEESKRRPWLVAAWPGMANVAIIAASHLVEELNMSAAEPMPPGSHFDVIDAEVRGGIISPARLPRGLFFIWRNPGGGRDLVVFLGESQPFSGTYAYAHELLDEAVRRFGIERVVTMAALASGLNPSENPKVSGVATDIKMLDELRTAEIEPLASGQLGGLNGLILSVAAERGIAGVCLLAEIPFFAMRVPNPKAARAALSVLSVLAGIDISLERLNKQAAIVDRALTEAMEMMNRAEESETPGEDEPPAHDPPDPGESQERDQTGGEPPVEPEPRRLSAADKARLEALFDEVRKNPHEAIRLKKELDRLGVFNEFEGRFLDLFRRAE